MNDGSPIIPLPPPKETTDFLHVTNDWLLKNDHAVIGVIL